MFSALALALFTAAAPAPKNVYVGMYLSDVSDFDLKAGRFKADLHVWVKWLGDEKQVPAISFENGELDEKQELGVESEGAWHSMQWRVQGTFRGEFPVHAFPFDRQTLPIIFGLNEDLGRLVPDLGASGMSPRFSVSGWSYEPYFSARAEERVYRSDLGSVWREGKNAKQRLTTFSVEMRRPFGPYLIKFALPLVLLLLMALLALFLPPERLDVRSAMGITALLSCIAFHYTQADTLPNVTYLVAADKLFLGSYVFVASTLLISIIAFRFSERRPEAARRADQVGLWMLPALTLLGLISLFAGVVLSHESIVEPGAPINPHLAEPLLRVAVTSLDTLGGGGQLPARAAQLVVRGADGAFKPVLAQEAPSMTNPSVRLLPNGGMRIRWKLRPEAQWSDGTRITADDLLFSLGLTADPLRNDVERIDDRTIDVTYTERHNDALGGFSVFPKSAASLALDGGREALTRAIGEGALLTAGAYTSTAFEPGKRATFVHNDRFAGMKPVFEKLEVHLMSPLEGAKALVAGEVDVLSSLTSESYELLKAEKTVRVLEQPGDMLWVLVPNLSSLPWSSLENRSALLTSLDRDAMARLLKPAPARVAFGWRESPPYPLPPAATLAHQSVKLFISPVQSKSDLQARLAAQITQDLAKIGITVELVEQPDVFEAVQRGDFEGLALLNRDTSDVTQFLNVRDVSKTSGAHYDEEMVERVEAIQGSLYVERRRALELELQEAWFKRLPMLPLVLTSRLAAVRADLKGPDWGVADSLWWNVSEWHLQAR